MSIVLNKSDFLFKNQLSKYEGKVRDVYTLKNGIMIMIASDRISAFDIVMPRGITFKGQVLNQIAVEMLNRTEDIVQNWLIENPDPNVSVGKKCDPLKVEMVVRGYLSGHAYREYEAGKRNLCGNKIPNGLKENEKFENPIITPTTKADKGLHDQDIDPVDIIKQNIINKSDYEKIHQISLDLYKRGSKIANDNGLILVDTKYEFGKTVGGKIILIDEIHTPDSSRYFYKEGYSVRQEEGLPQKQLSKEFVRQWLISNDFQGLEGQKLPKMDDERIESISQRYIELYEKITGKHFVKSNLNAIEKRIQTNVAEYFDQK